MKHNNRSFRYVAGACFAGEAVLELINLVQHVNIWNFLSLAGCALIAVSMFASLPVLTSIGAGINAIFEFRILINEFRFLIKFGILDWYPKFYLISHILFFVFWVILIVVGFNKKGAKPLCFVAGGVGILSFAIFTIGYKMNLGSFGLTFRDFLNFNILHILPIVGAFMIGMAVDCITAKASARTHAAASKAVSSAPVESQIDRLIKLKSLLDSGIISQEEFEAKKAQILGQ